MNYKTNSVIRDADFIANKDKHKAANLGYYMVYVVKLDGTKEACLLTDKDIADGIVRADKNKEDIVELSLVQRALSWVLSKFGK